MSKAVIYRDNGVELIENYNKLKIAKTKHSRKKTLEYLEDVFSDFDEHLRGVSSPHDEGVKFKDCVSNIKWQFPNDT